MVTTSQLSASTANIEQALIGLPSTNKVQAPQTCTSHPSFAPVRPNSSRTRSSSVSRGSTSAVLSTPLTVREIAFFMRCSVQSKIQNPITVQNPNLFDPISRQSKPVLSCVEISKL